MAEYIVQEKTVYEVLEIISDSDKCYIMDTFDSESEAEAYKEECENEGNEDE